MRSQIVWQILISIFLHLVPSDNIVEFPVPQVEINNRTNVDPTLGSNFRLHCWNPTVGGQSK